MGMGTVRGTVTTDGREDRQIFLRKYYYRCETGVNILAQISQFFPDGNEKFTILPGTLFTKDMFG